jgi:hypothetical protein
MNLIRLVVFGFLALSVVYLSVALYSRSVRREKLENRWAEDNPGNTDEAARDAFVNEGMVQYQNGLRRKLIVLVYIVPTVVVAAILYFTN